MNKKLDDFQEKIGVRFNNIDLLKEALTHRSYPNENTSWPHRDNERLEFLGDAVLELAATTYLFNHFDNKEEGDLTIYRAALVNTKNLSKVAQEIGLDKEIFMSKGETQGFSGRAKETVSANAMEALIGAIYLDRGYDDAYKFIQRFILIHLSEVEEQGAKDPKSIVQEMAQSKYKITPTYRILNESGPAHKRKFTIGLYFNGELKSKGKGNSKQEAETDAAQTFLDSTN